MIFMVKAIKNNWNKRVIHHSILLGTMINSRIDMELWLELFLAEWLRLEHLLILEKI
jgi:hypothetical protein